MSPSAPPTYDGTPTPWNQYDLPRIWDMVKDEDGRISREQLQAWQEKFDLLTDQVKRLRGYRQDIAAKWPPATSQASRVFLDKLDGLIASMEEARSGAIMIKVGLDQITTAIDQARTEVQTLYLKSLDPKAADDAWARMHPNLSWASAARSLDWGWPDQYKQICLDQARTAMRQADQTVLEASSWMAPPAGRFIETFTTLPADPPSAGGSGGGHGSGGGGRVPLIPPPHFDPPPPLQPTDGPVLTGGAAPPGSGGPGLPGSPAVPGGPVGPGVPPGALPPSGGTPGWLNRTPSGQTSTRPGGVFGPPPVVEEPGVVGGRGTTGRSPGVLGGRSAGPSGIVPGAGPAGVGRPEATGRIRPGRSGAITGRTASGHTVNISGMPAQRQGDGVVDRSMEEYTARRSRRRQADPDDPWAVQEGVSPVIEPQPEPEHDPGPGVIGIDR